MSMFIVKEKCSNKFAKVIPLKLCLLKFYTN